MVTEVSHREVRGTSLAAHWPLEPITDEQSYWQVIAILDRLFLLRREKNREEIAYFQALAEIAHEYECSKA